MDKPIATKFIADMKIRHIGKREYAKKLKKWLMIKNI